jgi:glycosyltransferase involved in cell wall biosynthesis
MKAETLVILTPGFPDGALDSTCLPAQQNFILSVQKIYPWLRIRVLAFQYPYAQKNYSWNGIRVTSLGGKNQGRMRRLLTWRRAWRELENIHANEKIVGLISFGECCLIGKWFAQRNSLLHFCWILGQDARPGNRFVRITKAPAEQLVAMSDFLSAEFARNYHLRPAHLVTNGVNAIHREKDALRDIDILGAGSLIPLKQYEVFLDCIHFLKKSRPGLKAVLCGKGPEKSRLLHYARKLNILDQVHFLDEVPHADLLHLMLRSKVLLHPSAYEGFSTVCLEALTAGAWVVSLTRPMVQPINGWMQAGDGKGLLLKLTEALNQESEPEFPSGFTMDRSAEKMMDLLGIQPSAEVHELVGDGFKGEV